MSTFSILFIKFYYTVMNLIKELIFNFVIAWLLGKLDSN
jgi:hypothetical protein